MTQNHRHENNINTVNIKYPEFAIAAFSFYCITNHLDVLSVMCYLIIPICIEWNICSLVFNLHLFSMLVKNTLKFKFKYIFLLHLWSGHSVSVGLDSICWGFWDPWNWCWSLWLHCRCEIMWLKAPDLAKSKSETHSI